MRSFLISQTRASGGHFVKLSADKAESKENGNHGSGPEVIKKISCSTQLSTKFILLINVKMPTIVGILTFISKINTTSESFCLFV